MRKATPENLTQLPLKKKSAILAKLGTIISAERGLAILNAGNDVMSHVDAAWPMLLPSFSYDAVAILGFGKPSGKPLPKPDSGEIVIRYGGWSLKDLRENPLIREKGLMWIQDWYDEYAWGTEGVESGVYRLRLPIPNSDDKTSDEQDALLLPDEVRTPICLDATALLVHRLRGGRNLLGDEGFVRSLSRTLPKDIEAGCVWDSGRLRIRGLLPDVKHSLAWASGARIAA